MYQLNIYTDAHDDEPDQTATVGNIGDTVFAAAKEAESLAEEACRLQVGTAGEGELFEMYPDPGHGTVVVTEVGGDVEPVEDVRESFDHSDAPGMDDSELPHGWSRFDTAAGEASGVEAYVFANGHQVLITESSGEYFVLAYPEHSMADLCGFVRPLLTDQAPEHGDLPTADTLRDAREFARGYMNAVRYYEAGTTTFDPFEKQG